MSDKQDLINLANDLLVALKQNGVFHIENIYAICSEHGLHTAELLPEDQLDEAPWTDTIIRAMACTSVKDKVGSKAVYKAFGSMVTTDAVVVPRVTEEDTPKPEQPRKRRKRRTRAEMEAARAAEQTEKAKPKIKMVKEILSKKMEKTVVTGLTPTSIPMDWDTATATTANYRAWAKIAVPTAKTGRWTKEACISAIRHYFDDQEVPEPTEELTPAVATDIPQVLAPTPPPPAEVPVSVPPPPPSIVTELPPEVPMVPPAPRAPGPIPPPPPLATEN